MLSTNLQQCLQSIEAQWVGYLRDKPKSEKYLYRDFYTEIEKEKSDLNALTETSKHLSYYLLKRQNMFSKDPDDYLIQYDILLSAIKQIDSWEYSELFKLARDNYGVSDSNGNRIPINGLLWTCLRDSNKCLTYEELFAECKKREYSSITDKHLLAKCYQIHTGFLREIDVALRIYDIRPRCLIYRNNLRDWAKGGWDLRVMTRGREFKFAVCHKGSTSSRYNELRKDKKRDSDVFVLTAARNGSGLDRILKFEISDILNLV